MTILGNTVIHFMERNIERLKTVSYLSQFEIQPAPFVAAEMSIAGYEIRTVPEEIEFQIKQAIHDLFENFCIRDGYVVPICSIGLSDGSALFGDLRQKGKRFFIEFYWSYLRTYKYIQTSVFYEAELNLTDRSIRW